MIIIFGSFKFTTTIATRYERIRESIETLNSNLSNSISGILNVKSFTRENKELQRIDVSSNEVRSANYHAIKLSAAFIPIIRVAILFGFTATLIIGGFLALDGEIKVATYSVLLFITQRLLWPLTELGDTFDLYQRAMASFSRIFSLKNETPDIKNGTKVKEGATVCQWDPFNGVIVSEFTGKIVFENIEQGVTYQVEIDEQTGFQEKVISESRNKKLIPTLSISDKKGNILRSYNLPVGAHLIVNEGEQM